MQPRPERRISSGEAAGRAAQSREPEEGWCAGRRDGRWVRVLADCAQEARDALRSGDQCAQHEARAALGALLEVDLERALQELAPGTVAGAVSPARRKRLGVLFAERVAMLADVVVRSGLGRWWHDALTPAVRGAEHPAVRDQVRPRWRHRRRQATEEGKRVEVDGDGAVGERALELDADEAVRGLKAGKATPTRIAIPHAP